MSARERAALVCGYLCIALTGLGVVAIGALGASTLTVALFVAGLAGVVGCTVALVQAEQGGQRPASRAG